MKKLLLFLITIPFALTLVVGCSDSNNASTDTDKEKATETKEGEQQDQATSKADAQEATTDEEKSEETGISEEDALEIASEFYHAVITAATNDDFTAFNNHYSSNVDQGIVQQDFEFFKNKVNEGLKENLDIEIMFATDEVIGASVMEYTNINSGNDTSHSNSTLKFYIENFDGEWKYSSSDKIAKGYDTFLTSLYDKYGEEYFNNGFVNGSHYLLFDKVLRNNIGLDIYKMKPNSDGSLELELALSNGFDYDIYAIEFNELILYSGANQVTFADLSGETLDTTQIIYSKDIAIIPFHINPEDLIVPVDQIDFTNAGVSSNISNKNRDK